MNELLMGINEAKGSGETPVGLIWTRLTSPAGITGIDSQAMATDPTGQYVYLFGGRVNGTGNASHSNRLYRYQISTGTWELIGAITASPARYLCSLTALDTGLYVMGGTNATVQQSQVLRIETTDWSTSVKAAGPAWRGITASILADGRIMTLGGLDGSSQYVSQSRIYDPIANTWGAPAALPTTIGGYGVSLCRLGDRNYVYGGYRNVTDGARTGLRYTKVEGVWEATGTDTQTHLPARYSCGVATISDRYMVCVAGNGSPNVVSVYDWVLDVWSDFTLPSSGTLAPVARNNMVGTSIGTGTAAYFLGGSNAGGQLNDFWRLELKF